MSEQDIQEFSIDDVNQEEKDFLTYMYGNDLEKTSENNPLEVQWWVEAFQTVKAGKWPKFNWPAALGVWFWTLRKKNFKFSLLLSMYTLIFSAALFLLEKFALSNELKFLLVVGFAKFPIIGVLVLLPILITIWFLSPIFISGSFGPKCIIDQYLKNKQLDVDQVNGRTPFVHVILPFALSTASLVAGVLLIPKDVLPVWAHPLLSWGVIIAYTFALMKFWLPAKEANEA